MAKNNPNPYFEKSAEDSAEVSAIRDRIDELQNFYDFSPVAYLTFDPGGQILSINLTGAIMLNIVRKERVGRSLYEFFAREDKDTLFLHLRNLFQTKNPQSCRLRIVPESGRSFDASLISNFAEFRSGGTYGSMVITDISDIIQGELALRDSEERLRVAIEGGRLGTWDHDLITGEILWNPILYGLLGRDPGGPAITGESFYEYIHPEDRERVDLNVADKLKAGDEFVDEFRIIRDDGEVLWLASAGRIYRDEAGRPVRIAGVNYDITDRKQMEEELRRSHEDLEKRVAERTMEWEKVNAELIREIDKREQFEADLKAQGEKLLASYNQRAFLSRLMVDLLEKERREIVNSLHEEIGQIMSGLMLQLEKLKFYPAVDNPALIEQISAIQDALRGAVKKARNISRSLRSDVLEQYGLIPALKELINETKHTSDIQIQFFTKNIPKNLSQHRALVIYRIVQESLTNILRYSGAQEVSINLVKKDGMLLLTIEDYGVGFDYDAVFQESSHGKGPLGLIIMRERVAQLGGKFYIESVPGRGTHVLAEIPLDAEGKVFSEQ